MRWSFDFKQRNKVAIAFTTAVILIVLVNWFVSYTMEQVSKNFKSVYQDRLIPSLDISDMLERYYQNRMLLEEHIVATNAKSQDSLQQLILANTQSVDSLISKFEATYLVDQELQELATYKTRFAALVKAQNKVIALSADGNKAAARQVYRTEGYISFQHLLEPLHALIKVQGDIGQELYTSADKSVKLLKALTYLVIGLALIVALIVGTLLQTSRKLNNIKPQNYHLN